MTNLKFDFTVTASETVTSKCGHVVNYNVLRVTFRLNKLTSKDLSHLTVVDINSALQLVIWSRLIEVSSL